MYKRSSYTKLKAKLNFKSRLESEFANLNTKQLKFRKLKKCQPSSQRRKYCMAPAQMMQTGQSPRAGPLNSRRCSILLSANPIELLLFLLFGKLSP